MGILEGMGMAHPERAVSNISAANRNISLLFSLGILYILTRNALIS